MDEREIRFQTPAEAAEEEQAWREFAQPGARIPLLWEGGVTMLEIADVGPDGSVILRSPAD